MLCPMPPMPPRSHLVEDFSNRAVGALTGQGWSAPDGTTAVTMAVQAESGSLSGRAVLMDKTSSDGARKVSMDAAGTVTDAEILTRFKVIDTLNFEGPYINIRGGSGSDDAVFAYPCGPSVPVSAYRNQFNMDKNVSGSATIIDRDAFVPVVGTWYWVRLRAESTTFSAKIWEDGDAEPAFQISGTAAVPASGVVAMGIFETTDDYVFDYFSVGLDGTTAPFPQG